MIRFGASTRSYVLREKPAMPSSALKLSENASENTQHGDEEGTKGGLLGLPESDTELDVSSATSHQKLVSFLQYHCKDGSI